MHTVIRLPHIILFIGPINTFVSQKKVFQSKAKKGWVEKYLPEVFF